MPPEKKTPPATILLGAAIGLGAFVICLYLGYRLTIWLAADVFSIPFALMTLTDLARAGLAVICVIATPFVSLAAAAEASGEKDW